ncbi:hypothetical protein BSS2_II0504 [Brucella suis bv. 1 str. S2]|uniref:Uncharacterized protein n=2 Tax=Brucella TaxID=234 RepID=A9MBH0_BRUC2|nr:hypothetical protein BRA0529 [Brucella suis 1330]ABX63707.1 Hypothetical protein, conserved [Brucella canis ATCC 23365]AEU07668.1 hypothetical protein BSVBI22_B0523 [Brucella suis VBI22]AHN48267.1 hypothetical protein BSS2_II0504 [Brucella suis bv. 1 str. S2]CDL78070.1 unnamed protein product [Brucella canis str. Oliveri]
MNSPPTMGITTLCETQDIANLRLVFRWFWHLCMNTLQYLLRNGAFLFGRPNDYASHRSFSLFIGIRQPPGCPSQAPRMYEWMKY